VGPGRVHITGASGAGVTTLGRALAQHYAIPHFDADDFYWMPTAETFTDKRPEAERVSLLQALIGSRPDVVLSGSIAGWGNALIAEIDAVIFVRTAQAMRLTRLRDREVLRYGEEAVQEDGPRYLQMESFLRWAERYDDPEFTGRSLTGHRAWLAGLGCTVIEVDGSRSLEALTRQVTRSLDSLAEAAQPR